MNIDKTGPMGTGAIGRGRGGCNGEAVVSVRLGHRQGDGCGNQNSGRGRGCNQGMGYQNRGPNGRDEKTYLEQNIKAHQNQLNAMQKRFDELNKQDN